MKRDVFYTEGEAKKLAKSQRRTLWALLSMPLLMQHMWLTYNWWENPHYWENRKILLKLLKNGDFEIMNVKISGEFYRKSIDIKFTDSETVYNIWLWNDNGLTLGTYDNYMISHDIIGLFNDGPIESYRINRCWKLLDKYTNKLGERNEIN
jgi:hypothetical protein